ncbi:capsular polysaccharide biosynthesis protein [Planktomarina temperata]|uniref:capsular polysaccharide biosynthesis protein n=1 Tax=Planktomarina temperata TaxID=1284658 RepID=UPI0035C7A599
MAPHLDTEPKPAAPIARQALSFALGAFTQRRINRILDLAGHAPRLGWPGPSDQILAWGNGISAKRGAWVAAVTGAQLLHIEDAFLRSVLPGRSGHAPLGLLIDPQACHFDASRPSALEDLLKTQSLECPALLERSAAAMARIAKHKLTKYSGVPRDALCPKPGFVLVIDQTRGDASIEKGAANAQTFQQMLAAARAEHPTAHIVIKTHPETQLGYRAGHFSAEALDDDMELLTHAIAPQDLFVAARAVYTVTSQMGFEAIWAGHRPVVFGQPFYAGWGLTRDVQPIHRRGRSLTAAQLFAGAMMLYPKWYDPCRDRLCNLEHVLDQLEAETRAWRDDHAGWEARGISLWKRQPLQKFFGRHRPLRFQSKPGSHHPAMAWGAGPHPDGAHHLEDGFLRSKGLGAQLVAPLSLVLDRAGIYFDPNRPSDLETMIANSLHLSAQERQRAAELQNRLITGSISKYNPPPSTALSLPPGRRILVPGQVEDDASVRLGTRDICTNLALLRSTREQNPDAIVIYKPHPDVEAGLRPGALSEATGYCDIIAADCDPISLINQVDEVWTMTSLLGFEALIRGKAITCLGLPFYSGWGLTHDRHELQRRQARPDILGLIHACLIEYPRYFDPMSKLPCPPEVVIERLAAAADLPQAWYLRPLAKIQGVFASQAHLWRNMR